MGVGLLEPKQRRRIVFHQGIEVSDICFPEVEGWKSLRNSLRELMGLPNIFGCKSDAQRAGIAGIRFTEAHELT